MCFFSIELCTWRRSIVQLVKPTEKSGFLHLIKQLDDAFDLIFFLSLRESTFQQSFIRRFKKKIQIKF